MATLDQLPPEQRAIVELVVQRGRSYETLAEVLQVPQARVRELAREALTELSPRTASRVDVDRRGQVADYLMRQQAPEEESATRDYLKQSEPARAWALSLLGSLDPLSENGAAPSVPEPAGAQAIEAAPAATVEDRLRTRERERVRKEPVREGEAGEEGGGGAGSGCARGRRSRRRRPSRRPPSRSASCPQRRSRPSSAAESSGRSPASRSWRGLSWPCSRSQASSRATRRARAAPRRRPPRARPPRRPAARPPPVSRRCRWWVASRSTRSARTTSRRASRTSCSRGTSATSSSRRRCRRCRTARRPRP